jgi:hypothetical protein
MLGDRLVQEPRRSYAKLCFWRNPTQQVIDTVIR